LANLISGTKETGKETFKVNLFSKFDIFDTTETEEEDEKPEELTFDCRVARKVDINFDLSNNVSSSEADDLLDLMDS